MAGAGTTVETGRTHEPSRAEQLRGNLLADLTYFRRSRLLWAFLLVFLLLTGLTSLPALFTRSSVQSFNTLQEIFSTLNVFLLFFAGGMSLFIISSHVRNRSLKMVFTKPCSPGLWLGSAFLSTVTVSLLLNCFVLGSSLILSAFWHVPVRPGLVFVSLDTFAASVGIIAYLMLLASVMHPAIAAAFALVFSSGLFYEGQVWAETVIRSGSSSFSIRVLERLFHYLYMIFPMVHPFDQKTAGIYTSLRVLRTEWRYPFYCFGYALALSALCYLLALFALQKKKYI